MIPTEQLTAATDDTATTPFLFWNELNVCAGAAALACPQCAGPNLHLDTADFATPTDSHYTPAVGVSIDPTTGAVLADNQAPHCMRARTGDRCCRSATGAMEAAMAASNSGRQRR